MATQYSDSSKLAARARLHREFSTAEVGWFTWVARQLPVSPGAKILDVGCGPGWFWPEAVAALPRLRSPCSTSPRAWSMKPSNGAVRCHWHQ